MLDLYTNNDNQIVLRHGPLNVKGINIPIDGVDIQLYDVFKEFTTFIEQKQKSSICETITIILESYVYNKATFKTLNIEGLADQYLYKENPNLSTLSAVCNKIIIFTSHTKDKAEGIHPQKLYKENHFKYYKGGYSLSALDFEKCEERAEGRAKYTDKTVNIFCFNHFSPISALIERAILVKPLLHIGEEAIDQALQPLNIPFKLATTLQDPIKAFNEIQSLTTHLDNCRGQDIKDSFFPTIIAVDFIEKGSGVFLCSDDPRCLYGAESNSASKEISDYFVKLIGHATPDNDKDTIAKSDYLSFGFSITVGVALVGYCISQFFAYPEINLPFPYFSTMSEY